MMTNTGTHCEEEEEDDRTLRRAPRNAVRHVRRAPRNAVRHARSEESSE